MFTFIFLILSCGDIELTGEAAAKPIGETLQSVIDSRRAIKSGIATIDAETTTFNEERKSVGKYRNIYYWDEGHFRRDVTGANGETQYLCYNCVERGHHFSFTDHVFQDNEGKTFKVPLSVFDDEFVKPKREDVGDFRLVGLSYLRVGDFSWKDLRYMEELTLPPEKWEKRARFGLNEYEFGFRQSGGLINISYGVEGSVKRIRVHDGRVIEFSHFLKGADGVAHGSTYYCNYFGGILPETGSFVSSIDGVRVEEQYKFTVRSLNEPIDPATFSMSGIESIKAAQPISWVSNSPPPAKGNLVWDAQKVVGLNMTPNVRKIPIRPIGWWMTGFGLTILLTWRAFLFWDRKNSRGSQKS